MLRSSNLLKKDLNKITHYFSDEQRLYMWSVVNFNNYAKFQYTIARTTVSRRGTPSRRTRRAQATQQN